MRISLAIYLEVCKYVKSKNWMTRNISLHEILSFDPSPLKTTHVNTSDAEICAGRWGCFCVTSLLAVMIPTLRRWISCCLKMSCSLYQACRWSLAQRGLALCLQAMYDCNSCQIAPIIVPSSERIWSSLSEVVIIIQVINVNRMAQYTLCKDHAIHYTR